ncbi:hypothetical protein [Ignavigranum ruoffiae]|uniref:hypothetical protein n=1 Tax=Ignavigranum ruoffiae TaxID=89093 RepID=UPI0024AE6161|nr:hypothetical protein [Ignavigranum ruoffiae]
MEFREGAFDFQTSQQNRYVAEYNTKFGQRIHKGFGKVHYELMSLLEQNLPVYQACLTQTAMDTQAS